MAYKTRTAGTWDAALGLILLGVVLLLLLALMFYDPRQVPLWMPLIASTNEGSGILHNPSGVIGAIAAGYLYFLFGAAAYLWIIVLGGFGFAKLVIRNFQMAERIGWSALMVVSGAALVQMQPWFFADWGDRFGIEGPGGWIGKWVVKGAFEVSLGSVGAPLVLGVIYAASLVLAIGFHPIHVIRDAWQRVRTRAEEAKRLRLARMEDEERMELERKELEKKADKLAKKMRKTSRAEPSAGPVPGSGDETPKIIDANAPAGNRPTLAEIEAARKKVAGPSLPSLTGLQLENYQLPPLSLLDEIDENDRGPTDYDELRAIQQTILETLAEFGIEATAGDITFGPTITRYEVKPVRGVRVDRIASLERDIARATRAARINILAPIPGKDTVGIEIANAKKVKVTLRELLETDDWLGASSKLPLALGKDVYGRPIVADLAKMPHCLVAGTTGSGKSVCINSIIASLLFRFSPEELRFIMIDPKVVEMQIYNKLPHLVTPVVTDPKKVLMALKWVVDEMELRYRIFAKVGVRNISGFADYLKAQSAQTEGGEGQGGVAEDSTEGQAKGLADQAEGMESADEEMPDEPPPPPPRNARDHDVIVPTSMPYIVVIVDELADLMQTAPAEVEGSIARITQMARAAGIHVIVATQTPRADVVTGIIKANIPSRVAFQVASGLDSRVILDQKGAEKLLGQGDMMYLPPGSSELKRAQGVFVNDDEIHRLVDFVASQAEPKFEPSIHEKLQSDAPAEEDVTDEDEELLDKFLEIMKQERRASTSMFQRRLRLGYSRAARIVDIMEKRGILGPVNGSKDREILIDLESI
ncbi:MAG: hypothetical protein Fur0032_06220 [Terrimicrobiaceae bacterium]